MFYQNVKFTCSVIVFPVLTTVLKTRTLTKPLCLIAGKVKIKLTSVMMGIIL